VVFGANDGLVSNVALVAAVAGGTTDSKIIVLGGIAGLVAGAISMALGAYVSTKSEREFRDSEEARERWEIEHMRDQEIAETKRIFRLKGITGPLLDEVVDAVSRDQDQWVKLMMTEELGFPDQPPRPGISAVVMGIAFAVAAFFPVAPYLVLDDRSALAASIGFTGAALFAVGGWRASLSNGNALRSGIEMVMLAAAAVTAAYLVGVLVGLVI
jgi:VIT1/CCC1 family predicted Fe2+/Mn2+ transporter